jgi:hypothetical protein
MAITVPPLRLRQEQVNPLTAADHDYNLSTLRDSINAGSHLTGVVLNPDGTLKDGAVNKSSIIADRVVTRDALHWHANHYAVTEQATNSGGFTNYSVTVPPNPAQPADPCEDPTSVAYNAGSVSGDPNNSPHKSFAAPIKFTGANDTDGPCQIAVNGDALKEMLKPDGSQLEVGNVPDGLVSWIIYDPQRDKFIIATIQKTDRIVLEKGPETAPGPGLTQILNHTNGRPPDICQVRLTPIDDSGANDHGYTTEDSVDLSSFYFVWGAGGESNYQVEQQFTLYHTANTSVLQCLGVPTADGAGASTWTVIHKNAKSFHSVDHSKWEVNWKAIWL